MCVMKRSIKGCGIFDFQFHLRDIIFIEVHAIRVISLLLYIISCLKPLHVIIFYFIQFKLALAVESYALSGAT